MKREYEKQKWAHDLETYNFWEPQIYEDKCIPWMRWTVVTSSRTAVMNRILEPIPVTTERKLWRLLVYVPFLCVLPLTRASRDAKSQQIILRYIVQYRSIPLVTWYLFKEMLFICLLVVSPLLPPPLPLWMKICGMKN